MGLRRSCALRTSADVKHQRRSPARPSTRPRSCAQVLLAWCGDRSGWVVLLLLLPVLNCCFSFLYWMNCCSSLYWRPGGGPTGQGPGLTRRLERRPRQGDGVRRSGPGRCEVLGKEMAQVMVLAMRDMGEPRRKTDAWFCFAGRNVSQCRTTLVVIWVIK